MHWVVDGMNLIGSRPDGWWRDRAGARRRLVADSPPSWGPAPRSPWYSTGVPDRERSTPPRRWASRRASPRGARTPPTTPSWPWCRARRRRRAHRRDLGRGSGRLGATRRRSRRGGQGLPGRCPTAAPRARDLAVGRRQPAREDRPGGRATRGDTALPPSASATAALVSCPDAHSTPSASAGSASYAPRDTAVGHRQRIGEGGVGERVRRGVGDRGGDVPHAVVQHPVAHHDGVLVGGLDASSRCSRPGPRRHRR